MSRPFHFKEFSIYQENAAMKVGTDGVILGAWANNATTRKVLDIGCGTGLISLMMAQRFPEAQIKAIDIDDNAIMDAQNNINRSNWKDRISLERITILDLHELSYDLIVCNPPFFESDSRSPIKSRAMARSGHDLSFIKWLEKAKSLLSPDGSISFIYPIEGFNAIKKSAVDLGLYIQRYREVKPTREKPSHRVLIELSAEVSETEYEEELVIEISRHQYTNEYIQLTRDFYLKMD